MSLQWAVLPVAGRGTRMQPAAAVVPKALLPVGLRPMIHWALEEALDARIPGLILVVGPEQGLVRRYLARALEAAASDEPGLLARLGRKLRGARLEWIEQPQPAGVGDALIRCRELTGDADLGVLLPDNWFDADPPAIAQVARTREATGLCTLGLTLLEPGEGALFGNVGGVEVEPLGGDAYRLRSLQDKRPGIFTAPAAGPTLRGCARYALGPEFYEALLATGPPASGEWDDVPAFQSLIAGPGLAGHRIDGRHYDVGLPAGYLAAAAYLQRKDAQAGRPERST